GRDVDVTPPAHQTCTTGNGVTTADECVVHFDEALPERDMSQAIVGSAENASFKRGTNRAVADALDIKGTRAIDSDVLFALGPVQLPQGAPTAVHGADEVAEALQRISPERLGLDKVVAGVMN